MAQTRRQGRVPPILKHTLHSGPTEAQCGHALARSSARPINCLGGSHHVATAPASVEPRYALSASTTRSCSFRKSTGGVYGCHASPPGCMSPIPGAQRGLRGCAKGGGGRCQPEPARWVGGGSIARRAYAQPLNHPGGHILGAAGGGRAGHRTHAGECGSHDGRHRCRWPVCEQQAYKSPSVGLLVQFLEPRKNSTSCGSQFASFMKRHRCTVHRACARRVGTYSPPFL